MKYVDAIGSNVQLGNNAVILYFDENYDDYIVIADTGTISPCSFDVDEEAEELVFSFCGETAYEKASKKSTDLIIENTTLENLGVIGGSNQATINRQIDLLFGRERTIDAQLSCSSSNPVENKVITNALRLKQDLLESGINIKTINNQSLLGTGNITIEGGGSTVDIVTNWEQTLSDSKVPSEKLTKESIDGKANTNHTHGIIQSDGTANPSQITTDLVLNFALGVYSPIQQGGQNAIRVGTKLNSTVLVDGNAHSNIGTSANANQTSINTAIDTELGNKADNEDIPTNLSDLNNDMDFIEKSNTMGLVKNDGTIDTTTYLSSLPAHTHDDRYYTETEIDNALNSKQDTLISGTNIKTINNTSLLGTGNINIQGGGSITVDSTWITGSTNPAESQLIQSALSDKTDVGHTHLSSDVTDLIDVIYPIGSIYMSVNSVNPSTLFGGTWEQIKDKFLLSSGDTYNNGATGGSATVTLTENQMPTHTHIQDSHNHTQNAHNHTQNRHRHEMVGSKTTGISSGTYLRAGVGSATDSKYTDYTTPTNNEATATNQSATATNQSTGGGQAHENMPPYIVVNVWKRTA